MAIKRETIKSNKTPATIFIGCGGIGSDIVSRVARNAMLRRRRISDLLSLTLMRMI